MDEGVGSGFIIYQGTKVIFRDHNALPDDYTVFMAEIHAIKTAGEHILTQNQEHKPIKILVDSQAAIQAMNNPHIK